MRSLIAGLCLSLLVSTAMADPKADKVRAKQLYDEGLRHYNLAEYAEAITSWKESYLLTKAPLLLFNLGQAYRLSGDCTKAMTFYDNYEREDPEAKNREELDQAIALCKNAPVKPDKQEVPDKLTIPVPDKQVTPIKQPDPVPDKQAVPPPVPPPVPHASAPGNGKRVAGYILGGAGVGMTAVGIYFGLAARSQSKQLDGYKGEWGPKQNGIQQKGQRDARLGWTFDGVGVAAIAAGIVLYVIGGHHAAESPGVSVVPTTGGAELAWGTSF
jgi:tetratricopeptide (TPR) repeat protein